MGGNIKERQLFAARSGLYPKHTNRNVSVAGISQNSTRNFIDSYKHFVLSLLLLLNTGIFAQQDVVYSQIYASPMYLNPALAGNADCGRLTVNYRNQYPKIPDTYVSYQAGVDTYLPFLHGGVGFLFQSDRAGENTFVTNNISLIYNYQMMLSDYTALNAGFQFHYRQYAFGGNNLIFQDMIDINTGAISSGSQTDMLQKFVSHQWDYSAGLFFDFYEKYYLGFSGHHLTEAPSPYYAGDNINYLKRKYSVHGGAKLPVYVRNLYPIYVSPNFLVQLQDEVWRINTGLNLSYEFLTFGLWYHNTMQQSESIIGIIGVETSFFKFGYSYDFVLSGLSGVAGGAHELSIAYKFLCLKKNYKKNTINCPEF